MKLFEKRKGQAALEFLMTYGWAILVVLIVIGALAYFGVFNPSNLLPERCALQQGLACQDWRVSASSNAIILSLQNGMGTGILIQRVDFGTMSSPAMGCSATFTGSFGTESNVLYIGNGQSQTITTAACAPATSAAQMKQTNRKYKWWVNVTWFREDSSSSFAHVMTGELLARVE